MDRASSLHRRLCILILAALLCGCLPGGTAVPTTPAAAVALPTSTNADRTRETPTTTPEVPTATATPSAPRVALPETLPPALRAALIVPPDAVLDPAAELRFDVLENRPAASQPGTGWVYALVAPFPTVADEIALADLRSMWSGIKMDGLPFTSLLVDPSTLAVFHRLWGPAGSTVRSATTERLLDSAWADRSAWAIVPFEEVQPRWKVILVDGQSPLRKDFVPDEYGLTAYFGWQGAETDLALPPSNRQPEKLTTVMLTGVTALVRGTASLMERLGMDYPASDTGDWLREADILHINNEVPFARNCPQPYDWVGLVFCSQEEYIQLLEVVGTDVVELTGDHFQDWGPEAMLFTLDLYRQRGWKTYGGGASKEDAAQPATFEHNGNKIAFLGCNGKPPGYATASDSAPGALHCDMEDLTRRVQEQVQQGYLPIVTFQHLEYYQYIAHPLLQVDFQQAADAGAVIVSGSQAHQPHAFEFRDGAFLHYGLGNLFFDQTNQGDPPRTAFIDRHVIYNGRHIGTELLTIYFVDYARARPMTEAERAALLQTVFDASTW